MASRDPDRPPPVSVFSPEFLRLLAQLDEPAEAGGTDLASRTDYAGSWRLLALDHPQGGFGLFRCGEDPSTHPPAGAFADWHVALLFSAVLPTLALDPIFELGPTATAEGHPVWNRRALAGHLSTFDPAVVAAAHTAAAIARAPLASPPSSSPAVRSPSSAPPRSSPSTTSCAGASMAAAPPARPELALILYLLRTVCGLSQQDLARLSGIHPSSISAYERGKTTPTVENLEHLLDAMGLPLSVLEDARDFLTRLGGKRQLHSLRAFSAEQPAQRADTLAAVDIDRTAVEAGQAMERYVRASLLLQAGRTEDDA